MTAKDYLLLADIIRGLPRSFGLRRTVARHFAGQLHARNCRFNSEKFITACDANEQDTDE